MDGDNWYSDLNEAEMIQYDEFLKVSLYLIMQRNCIFLHVFHNKSYEINLINGDKE